MTALKLKWCIFALYLVLLNPVRVDARDPVMDMGIMQQDEETLEWFRDAKFGMFLHWGLYALRRRVNGIWIKPVSCGHHHCPDPGQSATPARTH